MSYKRVDENIINDIRHKAKIEDVISHYIDVIKKGNSYVAICPFHNDSNPSLHISVDKQIFKCFSCPEKTAGDVFTFVKKYKKIDYIAAVKEVAELIGYDYDFGEDIQSEQSFQETIGHKILSETISFTQNELNSVNGVKYKEYLSKRNISDELIEKYQFGYNPSNNLLYNFLHKKGYSDKDIVETGLARLTENGIKDVFYERLMIPIHDLYGHPIGFTARSLDSDAVSKYINTNETKLFVKGDIIFNYHRSFDSIREKKFVIICEGPMDVIAFNKAGFTNAICALGTAFTTNQLQQIKKVTKNIVLAFDGDKAGQGAIYKCGLLANSLGFNIKVMNNTTKLDPDEIINQYSCKELENMILKPMDWMQWIFNYYQSQYDLNNYSSKKEFSMKVVEQINQLKDEFDRENYLTQLASLTSFSIESLRKNVVETKQNNQVYPKLHQPITTLRYTGSYIAEGTIIKQMLLSYHNTQIYKDSLGVLIDEDLNRIGNAIIDQYRSYDVINVADFIGQLPTEGLKSILFDIIDQEIFNGSDDEMIIIDAINRAKQIRINDKIKEIRNLQKKVTDPNVVAKYEQEIKLLKENK